MIFQRPLCATALRQGLRSGPPRAPRPAAAARSPPVRFSVSIHIYMIHVCNKFECICICIGIGVDIDQDVDPSLDRDREKDRRL